MEFAAAHCVYLALLGLVDRLAWLLGCWEATTDDFLMLVTPVGISLLIMYNSMKVIAERGLYRREAAIALVDWSPSLVSGKQSGEPGTLVRYHLEGPTTEQQQLHIIQSVIRLHKSCSS